MKLVVAVGIAGLLLLGGRVVPVAGEDAELPVELPREQWARPEKGPEQPEAPPSLVKAGVSGFLRGEGSGSYTYTLREFAYTPGQGVGRAVYRIKPYLEWHPADGVEVEVEGQGYGMLLGHPLDSQFSLYQGYLELEPPERHEVSLKLGRQEFVYGSAFILGADAMHGGLTFDAGRLRLQPLTGLTCDLFGGSYAVQADPRYFRNLLAGAYLTYTPREGTGAEGYYLRDEGPTFGEPGEHLDILGLRGTARRGAVTLEIEPVFETGQRVNPATSALETVSAWGGHLDLSAALELGEMRQSFTVGYARGSGSQDAANGGSLRREFSNLLSDTTLKGDLGFIGDLSGVTVADPRTGGDVHASGLHIVTAGWGINLRSDLSFTAAARYFQADKSPAGVSPRLGIETDFILTWTFAEDLALVAAYDRFFTGNFFRDATGRCDDLQYGYLMFQFNVSGGKRKPAKS